MTESRVNHVCAVVVTYHPDQLTLNRLIDAMSPQVGTVVVVDNTPLASESHFLGEAVHAIRPGYNTGLAAAQNTGIDWARQHGYSHVLLLDQDSLPGEGMVWALWHALVNMPAHQAVAAVGPRFHDVREACHAPFVRVGFPFNRKLYCVHPEQTVACDFLISSGTLMPLDVLDAVGGMNEALFIDNVDLEWSFRVRAQGYALYGVCMATMYHHLGEARRFMPFGLGHIIVHGSPRLYYLVRNRLLLYRMPHVPGVWVAQDLPRLVVKLFLFGVVVGPRWRNLRYMLRGLFDGVRGRSGPYPVWVSHEPTER